jgi:hypothetical protein
MDGWLDGLDGRMDGWMDGDVLLHVCFILRILHLYLLFLVTFSSFKFFLLLLFSERKKKSTGSRERFLFGVGSGAVIFCFQTSKQEHYTTQHKQSVDMGSMGCFYVRRVVCWFCFRSCSGSEFSLMEGMMGGWL